MTIEGQPHSDTAEVNVLGAAMLDGDAASLIVDMLAPGDFFRPENADVFEAIRALWTEGRDPDALSVREYLVGPMGRKEFEGGEYLAKIVNAVPTAANATYFAGIVRSHAQRRALIKAAGRVVEVARDDGADIADVCDLAERAVFDVTETRGRDDPLTGADWAAAIRDYLDDPPGPGIETPIRALNSLIGGLKPKHLIVLAARPSLGKTSLAIQIATRAAFTDDVPVLFFSLEMGAVEMGFRVASIKTGIESKAFQSQDWRESATIVDERAVDNVLNRLERSPFSIDARATLSPLEMRAVARRHKRRHGLGLVVVDYMQLMHAPAAENRQQEVAAISRGLKACAMELDVPVLGVSQLNRELEKRNDHRPRLADLRESGQIEQDAHEVIMLHRESKYAKGHPDSVPSLAKIIVAKHRNGPTGEVKVTWIPATTEFKDHSPRTDEPKGYSGEHGDPFGETA